MDKKTRLVLIALLVVLLVFGIVIIVRPQIVGFVIAPTPPEEEGAWTLHFCPEENCMVFLNEQLANAESVSCAFYELNLFNTTQILAQKGALVFIDEDSTPSSYEAAVPIAGEGLMHHKFCVLDTGVVMTGSFNPTFASNAQNDNNLFIIESSHLSANYLAEIESLAGKDVRTPYPQITHNGFLIENYFCPRDSCETQVVRALGKAKQSVLFMEYTFTSNAIENTLKTLVKEDVEVRGVIEKFQSANKETYTLLKQARIDVRWDGNPKLMHHKVFIIDNTTVIFGSYNPTKAATEINEENILIIHDPAIAAQFIEEFERIWAAAK